MNLKFTLIILIFTTVLVTGSIYFLAFSTVNAQGVTRVVVDAVNQSINMTNSKKNGLTGSVAESRNINSSDYKDGSKRFAEVKKRITPHLENALSEKSLNIGSPIVLRSFKQERELEMWMLLENKENKENLQAPCYQHVHTWSIAGLSGKLGPKLKEGDGQSPEGFYDIKVGQLHPSSKYHLAFNVGYPNAFDKSLERTGSFIMVHGSTGSIGCLAMTDSYIEEIYTLVSAALKGGKQSSVQLHMFPFHMETENMSLHQESPHFPFWLNLKEGYDFFQSHKTVPHISVENKKYTFSK